MTKRSSDSVLYFVSVRAGLAACLLLQSAVLGVAAAQTAQSTAPMRAYGSFKPMDRAAVVESEGLDNQALNLSSSQHAEINKIVNAYLKDLAAADARFPTARGQPPGVEAIKARQAALVNFNTAVNKVLDEGQRDVWRKAQAKRRPKPEPNGLRPPGY